MNRQYILIKIILIISGIFLVSMALTAQPNQPGGPSGAF